MANFQEARFLGLTPRALGLSAVAVAIVVGLFFIPEAVKLFLEATPQVGSKQELVSEKPQPRQSASRSDTRTRASVSQDALGNLSNLNAEMRGSAGRPDEVGERRKLSQRKSVDDKNRESSKGGLFSGWDFNVKARQDTNQRIEAPATLSFEKIISREGAKFFKQGRGAIPRFLKQEGLSTSPAQVGVQPLQEAINVVVSGNSSSTSEEVAQRLRLAHVAALRGLRAAGADRGLMLRWLAIPVVRFIDVQGGIHLAKRIYEAFDPGFILSDLAVKQRKQRGWGSNGIAPANFRGEFSVFGTDVERVVAYSNGKMVRSFKLQRSRLGEPRSIRISGDAAGVWTFVIHDKFGARPYAKSYSFYPKVSVFRQSQNGSFQIGFLPGSNRYSLDRFFLVGASARPQPSDSVIATF